MPNYHHELDPGSTKFICPNCGRKTFTRFLSPNGGYEPPQYGRCDREHHCAYFLKPPERDLEWYDLPGNSIPNPPNPPSYIPAELFRQSLKGWEANHLTSYLSLIMGEQVINELCEMYHIGSAAIWAGATVFWQVDQNEKVRGGKVMGYDSSGHRIKGQITWVHAIPELKLKPFNLKQCLFGEHLLKQFPDHPVAIVESEKTAIIAAGYVPKAVWLASGGKSGLNADKLQCLKGRSVHLWPDLGAEVEWKAKALRISKEVPRIKVEVHTALEHISTDSDQQQGMDLADYLLQLDIAKVREDIRKESTRSAHSMGN